MSELHKFLFDGLPVRGMLVRLTGAWQEMLSRREPGSEYPAELRDLLGEMSAAAVLMQANIKFNGALVLQVMGDGPVKLAVAEAQPDLAFRATAKCVGAVAPGASLADLLNRQGQGRCAITLDPRDKLPGQQPYQGVVPLSDAGGAPLSRLSEVLEQYMRQSEQLETRLVLAANGGIAAGLLIQRLPVEGENNLGEQRREELSEAFNRIALLAGTLSAEELLTLDADTVLRRLFWEETLTRFEPQAPRFACTCSRERVSQMLRGLGVEEAESVLAERGEIEIGCDFCGRHYRFDAVDVGALFAPGAQAAGGGLQ
ncbi:MAG: Hsp33 family molecular chaperone HslO [Roseateles sp.]|uniref:Hsp33 family molecular chaperone HslO n=1 Tax=Roseateles sp. TaxID=1971397 RepID=UPI0039EAB4C7